MVKSKQLLELLGLTADLVTYESFWSHPTAVSGVPYIYSHIAVGRSKITPLQFGKKKQYDEIFLSDHVPDSCIHNLTKVLAHLTFC